eukprot:2355615-Prymnesium_polylepis.1
MAQIGALGRVRRGTQWRARDRAEFLLRRPGAGGRPLAPAGHQAKSIGDRSLTRDRREKRRPVMCATFFNVSGARRRRFG